jgi:hypothetical protein
MAEDLNFNRIVSQQFDRAAQYLKIHPALWSEIKACNNLFFQFPSVRFEMITTELKGSTNTVSTPTP